MKELNYCYRCGTELKKKFREGRNRYMCPSCGEIRWRNAAPVGGVFIVRDDEVLMIKRGNKPFRGKWSYPAGFIEFDERPEIGAARELREETGLKVDPESLVLVSTIHLEHPTQFVVGNAYAASFEDAEGDVQAGDDAEKARFWTVREMRERLEDMESQKVIDAAEKAIDRIKSRR